MMRFLALLIGLSLIAATAPAVACVGVQTYEDRMARWNPTPEQFDSIIDRSEIIVDGVISRYDPTRANGDTFTARLRISKVWKGEVSAEVPITMSVWVIGCTLPPQYDTPIRLAGTLDEGRLFYHAVFGLPLGNAVLDQKLREYQKMKPILDAKRARQMEAVRATTEALQQTAATGDVQAKLAFVAHLLHIGEEDRAYEVAGALRREGVKLSLADPLLLDPEQKDWADLKRIGGACYSDHGNFDDATFDRADFSGCAFRYSSFRNASFRGTDLIGSYFQDSDLTGAQYDCATKLPEDLDPKAAGMINVEGQCPVQ